MFRRVAIIGGGAAGAALLSELLERATAQPLHLDWYTGGGTTGRGVAYSTASERHLLNVRAASMGLFASRPNGFLEYAQQGDRSIAGTDFLSRRLYGDYLEAEIARALARAQSRGHDVRVLPFAVDSLVPEHDGVNVFHGDTTSRVEAAVLALGALPPQPLAGVSDAALASGNYITLPWRFLANVQPDPQPREVAIIGLGLTAVDVMLELAAQWPNAHFTAVSRHGLLPEVHLAQATAPSDDGGELHESMRDMPDIRRWLHLLREATAQSDDWRTVIDSLRPHTSALWATLPLNERARFLRHARWAWERSRHRMPQQVHDSITALEHSGRMRRMRGRVRQVECGNDNRLHLDLVHAEDVTTIAADLVIQTVGLDTDVRRTPDPLVRQLVTNGHIRPDPLGLGCEAGPGGQLRHDDQVWSRLFAMGSLLRGTLWESTAMPEIRQQARHLADKLLAD